MTTQNWLRWPLLAWAVVIAHMSCATYNHSPRTVIVATAQELVDAIDNDVEVVVRPGVYELGTLESSASKFVEVVEIEIGNRPDQKEVQISGVHNLTIRSAGVGRDVFIYTHHSYAHVLRIENSDEVLLDGLVLGHYPEDGWCRGGVLSVDNCHDVVVADSRLFGSGVFGLSATNSVLSVYSSIVEECSIVGVRAVASDIVIRDSVFLNNSGTYFDAVVDSSRGSTVFLKDSYITNTGSETESSIFSADIDSVVLLSNCTVTGNDVPLVANGSEERVIEVSED